MAIILGLTAGLLGIHNLFGPLYYLIGMVVANLINTGLISTKSSTQSDETTGVLNSQTFTLFAGITNQMWSFFFFWTFAYNLFHVYGAK